MATAHGLSIWVKQLDRGPASKLTDNGTGPNWLPDGLDMILATPSGVVKGPADGSVLPKLLIPTRGALSTPEVSPDGQWLIGGHAQDIDGLRVKGDTTPVSLVPGSVTERRGTFSPDGKWMAYEAEEATRFQIFVRPFPETQTSKRQLSVAGGFFPRWSRDGRELFYISDALEMIAVPVSLRPTFSAGTPRTLFSVAPMSGPIMPFDVHPDGRFLFSMRVGGSLSGRDEVVVVQNFFEELKAKVAKR